MKRFLFTFSDTGGGHRSAVQAVKEELELYYGAQAQITLSDILCTLGRWPFNRLPQWYPAMVKLRGIPWSIGYRLTDHPVVVATLTALTWPYIGRALTHLLRHTTPDVLVSFHALPNGALQLARKHLDYPLPSAVVALDLATVHAGWFAPGFELYITPTPTARARALHWGLPPERVVVAGMPVQRRFSTARALSPAQARAQLGLCQERPLILLVGGGDGMGPLAEVVTAVAQRCPQAQLVALAGHNQALQTQLAALQIIPPLITPGFAPNIEVWMRAADVLVTKAGPNTLAEAFLMGVPLVLYTALPGQETGNVAYMQTHGAGIWAPSPERAAVATQQLLANPQQRAQLIAHARALAAPDAAARIAQQVWALGEMGGIM